jgi:molybdopterin/thiamine biosynthesis adenylyltransferase
MGRNMQEKALTDFISSGALHKGRMLSEDEIALLKGEGVTFAVEGYITVGGNDVVLRVGVDDLFPQSLPKVYLNDPDMLGFIPHVGPGGSICYADTEGIILNTEYPVSLLNDAVTCAAQVLEEGITGTNRVDFMDEFMVYWGRLSPSKLILSFVRPEERVRRVYAYYDSDGNCSWIAADDSSVCSFFNYDLSPMKSLTQRSAIYIPLEKAAPITPPEPDKQWTIDEVRGIVKSNVSDQNLREMQRLCKKAKIEELVVLGLPRSSGEFTLVGLLFHQVTGGHPLIGGTAKDPPEPVLILRCDPQYLWPRGGGDVNLYTVNVMVVGCGSVGGHIALALARTGIGKLTLVDYDKMELENIFRHILGRDGLGAFKTKALKAQIERKYPFVEVSTCEQDIRQIVNCELTKLNMFDLVLFATGNPTTELHFNKLLHGMEKGPLALFSWVEPYGIGGHAFLTRPGTSGCLQCLYEPADDRQAALHSRVCFAEPGRSFGKDDLGCGSRYTPYSGLDAERTAGMTVRLALDGLNGREQGNPLISWKGSKDSLEAAGFETSYRYGQSLDQMHDRRYEYVRSDCPVCGDSIR